MKILRELKLYASAERGMLKYIVEIVTTRGPVTGEAYSLDEAVREALKLADAAEED